MQHINAMHTLCCNLVPANSFPGLHPAVEALDVLGLLPGHLTDSCSSNPGPGLTEPSSWGSVIPVHLLPMMSQV